tara:strand:- start:4485 stop:7580 length:3096 start_codon:yes stop_codon:yes gene_type:complete
MHKTIDFVLNNKLLIVALSILAMITGILSYHNLPVDAFPDVSPALVQIFVETEGLAPEEIEKYVTYPIEISMNGLPDLDHIRSVSNFGLAVINIYFKEGTDLYFARQLVNERLQQAKEMIPNGFGSPVMGPITTGLGQILFYVLEDTTGLRSLQEMREIQDWVVKFNLQTIPGVTEVLSIGGEVKQFQVQIRPEDLMRYQLTLQEIKNSIEENNSNAGAQFIVKNSEEYIIRSIGLVEKIDDINKIVIKTTDGTPVYLNQVADVVIGGEIRRGLVSMNGAGEVVVGMVLKLIGSNTSDIIQAVKNKLDKINTILPQGVVVTPYYDQATLVSKCVATVTNALMQGVGLVILVLLVFMGGLRASVVVGFSIPFSVLFSFILMHQLNISANLMSLGGLAIAIGMMVDGTIVIVENVDRKLRENQSGKPKMVLIGEACKEVSRPILFSIIIIIIVFLPLFTLQGVEGVMFRPLAYTVTLAMLGSLIFALLVAPVFCYVFMCQPKNSSNGALPDEGFIIRFALKAYRPVIALFIKFRWAAVGIASTMLIVGIVVFPQLGSEFVPRLEEGDLLIRATMAPSISLEQAESMMTVFERQLLNEFPEVTRVVTRVGRGEIGAHSDPINSAEIFVALKPKDDWVTAQSLDELYAKMSNAFEEFPGVKFNFTQPIAAAVDELLTGTRAELALKLFGDNIEILKDKAAEIEKVIRSVPGAADVQKDQITGAPQLVVSINRKAIARYGLNIADIQDVVSMAIGGVSAGEVFEGVRRFDIYIRYSSGYRNTVDRIKHILIKAPNNVNLTLDELASISEIVGPRQITRENGQRFITIQCNVRGRDMGSFVSDAESAIAAEVKLPPGYLLKWGGQFELQQAANKRLSIVVPITLLLVFILLYSSFNSLRSSLLIILNIPLALVGGIVALWLSSQSLSVPASVGFIALFGIALENGLVLVTYINELCKQGIPVDEASTQGACLRLRPVLMTAATTALGLLPLLFSEGTGSEVQRPLATVVIGGLVSSTFLTLLIIPAIYKWFKPKDAR